MCTYVFVRVKLSDRGDQTLLTPLHVCPLVSSRLKAAPTSPARWAYRALRTYIQTNPGCGGDVAPLRDIDRDKAPSKSGLRIK